MHGVLDLGDGELGDGSRGERHPRGDRRGRTTHTSDSAPRDPDRPRREPRWACATRLIRMPPTARRAIGHGDDQDPAPTTAAAAQPGPNESPGGRSPGVAKPPVVDRVERRCSASWKPRSRSRTIASRPIRSAGPHRDGTPDPPWQRRSASPKEDRPSTGMRRNAAGAEPDDADRGSPGRPRRPGRRGPSPSAAPADRAASVPAPARRRRLAGRTEQAPNSRPNDSASSAATTRRASTVRTHGSTPAAAPPARRPAPRPRPCTSSAGAPAGAATAGAGARPGGDSGPNRWPAPRARATRRRRR